MLLALVATSAEAPSYPAAEKLLFWLLTVVMFGLLVHFAARSRGLSKRIRDMEVNQTNEAVTVLKSSLDTFGNKLEAMGKEFRAAIGDIARDFNAQARDVTGIKKGCTERHKDLDRRIDEIVRVNEREHGEIERKVEDQGKETERKVEILHRRITECAEKKRSKGGA